MEVNDKTLTKWTSRVADLDYLDGIIHFWADCEKEISNLSLSMQFMHDRTASENNSPAGFPSDLDRVSISVGLQRLHAVPWMIAG